MIKFRYGAFVGSALAFRLINASDNFYASDGTISSGAIKSSLTQITNRSSIHYAKNSFSINYYRFLFDRPSILFNYLFTFRALSVIGVFFPNSSLFNRIFNTAFEFQFENPFCRVKFISFINNTNKWSVMCNIIFYDLEKQRGFLTFERAHWDPKRIARLRSCRGHLMQTDA